MRTRIVYASYNNTNNKICQYSECVLEVLNGI